MRAPTCAQPSISAPSVRPLPNSPYGGARPKVPGHGGARPKEPEVSASASASSRIEEKRCQELDRSKYFSADTSDWRYRPGGPLYVPPSSEEGACAGPPDQAAAHEASRDSRPGPAVDASLSSTSVDQAVASVEPDSSQASQQSPMVPVHSDLGQGSQVSPD